MMNALSALLVQHSESASPRIVTALRAAGLVADAEQVESEGQVRAALERRSWDVIIAEECRPRFDALAALLLVRRMGLQTPFVVVADAIGEDNVAELMRRGANDCLAGDWASRLGSVMFARDSRRSVCWIFMIFGTNVSPTAWYIRTKFHLNVMHRC
jgi:DNA-binding NtrC family response regulator